MLPRRRTVNKDLSNARNVRSRQGTSPAINNSPRNVVLSMLAAGFHHALGMSVEQYTASIPGLIPRRCDRPERFNRLILVDRRLRVVKTAELLNVQLDATMTDDFLEDFWIRDYPEVEWVWCQDGRSARNTSIAHCREGGFQPLVEIGMTAIEGLCLFARDPSVTDEPDDHIIDLPGSTYRDARIDAHVGHALLYRQSGRIRLEWGSYHGSNILCGCASRRDMLLR
jgi:hypothetical protein